MSLKSNMDRFIATTDNNFDFSFDFKIQYGQIYSLDLELTSPAQK